VGSLPVTTGRKAMTMETPMNNTVKRTISVLIAGLTFFAFTAGAAAQNRPAGRTPVKNGSQRYVSIDFNNVDINVFIKFISELTNKNFIIDQRVRGKVTIISPSKISVDEAYKVFESVLDVHGFATVKTGDVIKIVPAADARTKNLETLIKKPKGASDNDQLVTQLIPLRYADPDDIKRLFTPMISRGSVVLSYGPTNTLIITDNYSNIARLMKILKTIDVPGVGREITVLPVHNADATKLLTLLETVFKNTGPAARKRRPTESNREAVFVADERTNSIILVASEDDTNRVRQLVDTLDKETPKGKERTHVYYLQYASAEDLAAVLKDLPKGGKGKTGGAAKQTASAVSGKVTITPDKATNSLIITADRDDYATLEDIIRKVDIPRAMVYIEALIMEVGTTKSFSLGTEWIAGTNTDLNNGRQGIVGGGFTKDTSNLQFDSSGNLIPSLASGFSLGLFGEAVDIGGISFPSIAAIAQAYKKDTDVNILSTPQLLTTDNQEASITVGKNVPYQTTTSTSNNDTYNSFEYRDVGKTLKITPQISKGRMVRLKLSLEVSSLAGSTQTDKPTTLKRTVDTTVMVKDGGTVVIGGLIDDSFNQTDYKVPCLGDIPGLGWLFKSRSKGDDKTNLYIFITPKVVETPEEATAISKPKKTHMDQLRETQIKLYGGEENSSMTLPPATAPQDDPPSDTTIENKDQGRRDGDGATAPTGSATEPSLAANEATGVNGSGGYIIQVQSFADEMSALESEARLKKLGYRAYIKQTDVKGKIWYRVQIGGLPDRAAAQSMRETLSTQGFAHTLIIK
jgi:general secretion pathway protein D